jgi:hypothetical protein
MNDPTKDDEKVACRCLTDWCRLEPDNGAEYCPDLEPNEFCAYQTAECDHDWLVERERYGDDADGNRGVWRNFKRCTKCGEEQ